MNTKKVTVEIWSDVVCPFCLLGKKKIEQAITKLNATDKVEIIWRSFQLDPTFPKNTSSPSMQYLSERKGYPVNQIKGMCQQLSLQGKEYNINFNFDASLAINTFDAHRLIHWAKSFGKANQLKEALMVAHFSEGMDLSKETQLFNIVEKIGLDIDGAKKVIQSDAYANNVAEDIQQASTLGIRGVPFFLVNGKKAISGAQNDQVFEQAIGAALKNLELESTTTESGVCVPNKECK